MTVLTIQGMESSNNPWPTTCPKTVFLLVGNPLSAIHWLQCRIFKFGTKCNKTLNWIQHAKRWEISMHKQAQMGNIKTNSVMKHLKRFFFFFIISS